MTTISIINDGEVLTMNIFMFNELPEDFGAICIETNTCVLGKVRYEEFNALVPGVDKSQFFNKLSRVTAKEIELL